MAKSYLVTAKNPEYAGKTFGLQFYGGKAVLTEEMVNPRLGRNVEEIREGFLGMEGYKIRPLSASAQAAVQATLAEAALAAEDGVDDGEEVQEDQEASGLQSGGAKDSAKATRSNRKG